MALVVRWNSLVVIIRQGSNMEKRINILLVEDEVITAMLMRKQMADIGYPVSEHVTTGEKAIVISKHNQPDIILMDIRLAGELDGIDATEAIKTECDIPVIFITGFDDKEIKARAEKIKPLGYFIKPLNLISLKIVLDAHFNQKSLSCN